MNQKKKYCKPYLFALSFLIGMLACVQYGCKTEFDKYYERPENLEGPIYQQLAVDPLFAEFVKAIDKLPEFKKAINTSGLYTCFAPENEAVKEYLRSIGKNSFDDFDMSKTADIETVRAFVDSHFVQDMYFEYNFNKLINDISFSTADRFRYFLRYREPDYEYFDKRVRYNRKVRPESKQISVFMNKYLTKYRMTADYKSLYGRDPGDFNVEGARILADKRDIAAVNGVIHGIDRVLLPKKNVNDILEDLNPVLHSINEFNTILFYNRTVTEQQASTGGQLDSLFTRYSLFGEDIYTESSMYTLLNPPKDAYEDYVTNNVLPGFYQNIDSVHFLTKMYLTQPYIYPYAAWSSHLEQGIWNFYGDTIRNPKYSSAVTASNGIVYNLDELMISPALKSVARGFMLNSNYSWFFDNATHLTAEVTETSIRTTMNSDNIDYLQDTKKKFTIFVPCNDALRSVDGYDITREIILNISRDAKFYNYRKGGRSMTILQKDSLFNYMVIPDTLITESDLASANNNWYETRLGNFIQIDRGTFNGVRIDRSERADNGIIHYFDKSVIPVKPTGTIGEVIKNDVDAKTNSEYSNFNTIIRAFRVEAEKKSADSSLPDDENSTLYDFLRYTANSYTLFLPTNAALDEYKTTYNLGDYGSDAKWGQIAKYLITKTRVYTDGTYKQDEAAMNPLPSDPTRFVSVFRTLVHADPSADDVWATFKITYPGGAMTVTNEAGDETGTVQDVTYNYTIVKDIEAVNGVIHVINKVLTPPDQFTVAADGSKKNTFTVTK
jgi:uncharacterized surface protein with fasciclin (FAS1) repeats